ncbi:hypothetical protein PoMZ_12625 [Pyricularia oryzae]|uniref:Uncharacterized protein n=1 Tax=Pyricularia oryzae TaxID=318829 RepID=A0A4P7NTG5_PYROR|nr:hypothetical protein PoMZ_12625 [Pyricularia oryzae]
MVGCMLTLSPLESLQRSPLAPPYTTNLGQAGCYSQARNGFQHRSRCAWRRDLVNLTGQFPTS